jgi:hypothetical protein
VKIVRYLRVSFLSRPRGLQLYRIESLHPPRHPLPAAVHRDMIQGISCRISRVELFLISLTVIGLKLAMCQSYASLYPYRFINTYSRFQDMRSFLYIYSNVWQSAPIFTCQRSRISSSTDWNSRLPKIWDRFCRIPDGQILTLGCTFCSDFQVLPRPFLCEFASLLSMRGKSLDGDM